MAGSLAALSGLGSGRLDRVGRQIEKIGEGRSSTHKQTGWGRGEAGNSSVAGLKNKCINASRRKGIGSLSGTALCRAPVRLERYGLFLALVRLTVKSGPGPTNLRRVVRPAGSCKGSSVAVPASGQRHGCAHLTVR
jgi:hypothetical protein